MGNIVWQNGSNDKQSCMWKPWQEIEEVSVDTVA